MNDKTKKEQGKIPYGQIARKISYGYLGVFGLLRDEIGELTEKLYARGEDIEKEARPKYRELSQDARDRFENRTREFRKRLPRLRITTERPTRDLLQSLDLPTRAQIRGLNRKLNTLSKKITEIESI